MNSCYTDDSPVKVYWCKCGKSIQHTGDESKFDRATKKEFKQAAEWGRKVEVMPLREFKTKPFMNCKCFNKS